MLVDRLRYEIRTQRFPIAGDCRGSGGICLALWLVAQSVACRCGRRGPEGVGGRSGRRREAPRFGMAGTRRRVHRYQRHSGRPAGGAAGRRGCGGDQGAAAGPHGEPGPEAASARCRGDPGARGRRPPRGRDPACRNADSNREARHREGEAAGDGGREPSREDQAAGRQSGPGPERLRPHARVEEPSPDCGLVGPGGLRAGVGSPAVGRAPCQEPSWRRRRRN